MKTLLTAFILAIISTSVISNLIMGNLAKEIGGEHKKGLFGGSVVKTISLGIDCERER